MEAQQTALLPLASLDPPIALLRMVDKGSVEYLELVDSIDRHGLLNSISVRQTPNSPDRYQIIDGMYRYTAHQDLGRESIPAIVLHNVADEDVLALQIQANAVGKETAPVEFARRLRRLIAMNPEWDMADLTGRINKGPKWIKERLELLHLKPEIQMLVDRGQMKLTSAIWLSKLPKRFQTEYTAHARVMSSKDFVVLARDLVQRYREAVKQGNLDAFYVTEWEPKARLRNLKEITREFEDSNVGPLICSEENLTTATEGFKAALKWVMRLDSQTVNKQRQKYEAQFFQNQKDTEN